ncbi:MAG: UDP-N-acetylmuramate dehydrogenase [bacterium]|nr:UDP-N-acetylmuramate dehydrogenase [bacterium]
MVKAAEEFVKAAPCMIRERVPLAPLSTFRVGGPARLLAEPMTEGELRAVMALVNDLKLPYFYVGLGSNLLISDAGFPGVVIRARGELTKIWRDGDLICAGPSARLLLLTAFAAKQSLSGMEPLAGIPGTVGGGLYMNAGAYGGEIADTFVDCRTLTASNRIETLTKSDIAFGYRAAPELQRVIALSSRYKLTAGDSYKISHEMRRVWMLRRDKQPIEHPSAGSIFKRPPGDFAGRLIEGAGCKGLRIGGAIVPGRHAGIFINDRAGSADDIVRLIRTVRKRVFDKYGILLETEVLPVGFETDPFSI